MISSADEYQFLGWFLQTMCARKVIEVGVFRGVTTLALARQLPADGVVRALDISAEYADIGKKAWEEAGVADKIDFRIGPAAESMRALLAEEGEAGTYDFVYIDANKDQYTEYYELALNLLRSGGVIAVDNTLFHGLVTKEKLITSNSNVKGVHELNERIRTDSRVSAVMTILADGVYFVRKL
ncbi:O-methyltransferase family protein [Angomonas deanei]|uniref:O-methyltransferase/Methyltransferase domain containing protein, putative n=1 Tax=Angomonas deanei TaxID=59799 RepID=A0A7G2CRG6_9TRYP|nr:O-methyltransferase family protein [Angomonas deanei]CAD2222396.1 O-methyltransferase/Methyltransferase domain containing protein, putative [Angomonas deanei]|eukprot:EPY20516.1 O-methyltransferase family protein [Angomonas deanei]